MRFTGREAVSSTDRDAQAHLAAILAGAEFVHVKQPGLLALAWSYFLRWLFRGLGYAASAGGPSVWVLRVIWGSVVLAALFAAFLAMRWYSRRAWTVNSPARSAEAVGGGPREWEGWWAASEECAARRAWREAIHAVYWAAISRFETQGLWPKDRARTPREYVTLFAQDTARSQSFTELTSRFERAWYGHRPAHEADLEAVRELFTRLGAR